jgi:membrane-associated phospholipid phosphatase
MYRRRVILARTISAFFAGAGFGRCFLTLFGVELGRVRQDLFTQIVDSRLIGDKLVLLSVTNALFLPQNFVALLALTNPFDGTDHELAAWFHERLSPAFVVVLHAFTNFGSGEWIGTVVFALALFFVWKRWWPSLVTWIVAVPGGMLLNEWVKVLVHRQRPFLDGPFVDWSGYSFASGHAIGATLLYGQLLLLVMPALKARHWRLVSIVSAISLVVLVGFSRIALGAHFLTDVLAGIFFGIIWLALCVVFNSGMRRGSFRSQAVVISPEDNAVLVSVERVAQRDSNF